MSENKPQNIDDGLEVTYRIPVERFQYADELSAENRKLRKGSHVLGIVLVVTAMLMFLFGWGVGSFRPLPFSNRIRHGVANATTVDSSTKIESVMAIMEKYWYFAPGIENLDTRLSDQALFGITSNEEDPHTQYMTSEEIEQFTQNINRNFVGIGVQFQSAQDGMHIITRVFRDSPAEKAGVLPGDIIHAVNGTVVDGMDSSEIKELVQGEEGTKVNMTFLRDGKTLEISIPRGQISHTVDAEILEGNIGYMSLAQFGESTGTEVREMLDQFKKEGASRLIIDLRDDGGGYLDALKDVLNCFLPADTVFILREYTDGTKEENRTSGGKYQFVDGIVLLVNDSTASASEAFTMAMKEKRDDVTIIGTKTYGKGSVQITRYFSDGSALKYTDSAWKSPSGVWVNNTGIEPDETVELHPVLSAEYKEMEEDAAFGYDTVSRETEIAQMCLDFLGYESMRTDGYFDKRTEEALKEFQKKLELDETGVLDRTSYDTLISQTVYEWYSDDSHDTQLMRAVELLRNRTSGASKEEVTETPSAAVKIDHSQIMMEETAVQAIRTDRDGII